MGNFGQKLSCKHATRLYLREQKPENCDGTDCRMGVPANLPELSEWTFNAGLGDTLLLWTCILDDLRMISCNRCPEHSFIDPETIDS